MDVTTNQAANSEFRLGGTTAQVSTEQNVSCHDPHNLEIRTHYEVSGYKLASELTVHLFVPKNFALGQWPMPELQSDLRSRVRLSIPVQEDHGLHEVENRVHLLAHALTTGDQERTLRTIKELGAALDETLKHLMYEHQKVVVGAHSLHVEPGVAIKTLQDLPQLITAVADLVTWVRNTVLSGELACAELEMLREYLSHLYVRYLSNLRREYEKIIPHLSRTSNPDYYRVRGHIEWHLDQLQRAEAEYREKLFASDERCRLSHEHNHGLCQEQEMVRRSQLKKFFQAAQFIDLSKRDAIPRVTQTTAFIGTASAAVLVAAFQDLYVNRMAQLTSPGLVVLCTGVFLYTLRDRLKDWAKERLKTTARQFVPDSEKRLMAAEKRLGTAKEWLKLKQPSELPAHILSHRYLGATIEKNLPEDVLVYRKTQEINVEGRANVGSRWGLHDNLRINVERYLKYMDAPVKEVAQLSREGQIQMQSRRRVYYFYLALVTTVYETPTGYKDFVLPRPSQARIPVRKLQCYRVVLDKNGIDRVEALG